MKLADFSLRKDFPDRLSCRAGIAELRTLLELPAGTSYYFCDIHGQGNKFFHIIHNKAGTIKRKIDAALPDLSDEEKVILLKLCYYTREQLARQQELLDTAGYDELLEQQILNLAKLTRHIGSKTARKIFYQEIGSSPLSDAIHELVTSSNDDKINHNDLLYQRNLIKEYRKLELLEELTVDLVGIMKTFLIHNYIINGDIPDRGPDTAQIIDYLMTDDKVSINWGNHDLLWMGAAAGSRELVLEMIRIQLRYNHYLILELDYKVDLRPLCEFALTTYREDPVAGFHCAAEVAEDNRYSAAELARMQKAVAVILWKLEAAREDELQTPSHLNRLQRNPEGELAVEIDGRLHILLDQDMPTLDPADPAALSAEEAQILDYLCRQLADSSRFYKQMKFLAERGGMYRIQDGILSYHAIVPVTRDGELSERNIMGETAQGRELFDLLTRRYREAFNGTPPTQQLLDLFYYGWKGPHSWTFGKSAMETFTRALVADKSTHKEHQSPYYTLLSDPQQGAQVAEKIIADFSSGPTPCKIDKIFNGHIPVKLEKNQAAVKAGGSVICGDGGFSEAYGDIGFVLISTSRGLYLNKLGHAVEKEDVLQKNEDILPERIWEEMFPQRKKLRECNLAPQIRDRIEQLKQLEESYIRKPEQ